MDKSFCHPYMQSITEETSNFDIDTDCFSRPDLALFVESLEIISRLERQKFERKQRLKKRKPNICPMMELVEQIRKITACAEKFTQKNRIQEADSDCTLSAPSGEEAENEQIIELEAKQLTPRSAHNTRVKQLSNKNGKVSPTCSMETDFDENYFSAPNSQQSSPRSSVQVDYNKKYASNKPTCSDSEESGVFPAHTEQCNNDVLYENIRPRSAVITKPKQRTMRSRIIGLVLKREYVEDSDTKSERKQTKKQLRAEQKRAKAAKRRDERRERLIDNLLKQSMSSLATKSHGRKAVAIEDGSVEERFLNKALRYLTL